jgi:hypothetical protein
MEDVMNEMIGHPDPGLDLSDGFKPHTSHWGVFSTRHSETGLEVRPYAGDPDPNGIIGNFPGALRHQARIAQPAIRRGWLERGPGPDDRRGRDEFVSVSWERALDLLGGELSRIRDTCGPGAVFGGSYGLVERRPLSSRTEPDSSLPEHRDGRLCAFGQHLFLGCIFGAAAADTGGLRRYHQTQRHLGADCDRD